MRSLKIAKTWRMSGLSKVAWFSGATRSDSLRPRGLAFLDCRSDARQGFIFEQAWTALRREAVQHRAAGLRWTGLHLEGDNASGDGGAGDSVFALADELLVRNAPGRMEQWHAFDRVLKRRAQPVDLDGFCLYGLVTALFVRAQGLSERFGDPMGAVADLDLALSFLGQRLHLDWLREASTWPFDALDLRINRDRLMEWIESASHGKHASAVERGRPPPFVLASDQLRTLKPPPVMRAHLPWNAWRSARSAGSAVSAEGSLGALECHRTGGARGSSAPLQVVVYGVHSTLVLEPATMLQAAFYPRPVEIQIYMRDCPEGNDQWSHHCALQCQALGECNPPKGSAELWVGLIKRIVEVIFGDPGLYYGFADYIDVLVQMYRIDVRMREAALYVCTAPFICSLLRSVFEKPILAYLGMQIQVAKDRQKDQLLLMHFKEMARNRCDNIIVVHNLMMREQIHYATSVRLPIVRPRSLYVHRGTPLRRLARVHDGPGRAPAWNRRVLFYRSSYVKLAPVLPVFEACLEAWEPAYPLSFRTVSSPSDFLSYTEMQRYRAVVVFPHDPALMCFYELYSLHGPALLVPRKEWMFKIQQFTGWPWSQTIGAVELAGLRAMQGLEAASASPAYAHYPWWRPEDSNPTQALYWYMLSDTYRMPHVLKFSSFAELLELLLAGARLRRSRAGMLRLSRKELQSGLRWYRRSVEWLLAAKAGCGPCALAGL